MARSAGDPPPARAAASVAATAAHRTAAAAAAAAAGQAIPCRRLHRPLLWAPPATVTRVHLLVDARLMRARPASCRLYLGGQPSVARLVTLHGCMSCHQPGSAAAAVWRTRPSAGATGGGAAPLQAAHRCISVRMCQCTCIGVRACM